jgi:hypothetical protein
VSVEIPEALIEKKRCWLQQKGSNSLPLPNVIVHLSCKKLDGPLQELLAATRPIPIRHGWRRQQRRSAVPNQPNSRSAAALTSQSSERTIPTKIPGWLGRRRRRRKMRRRRKRRRRRRRHVVVVLSKPLFSDPMSLWETRLPDTGKTINLETDSCQTCFKLPAEQKRGKIKDNVNPALALLSVRSSSVPRPPKNIIYGQEAEEEEEEEEEKREELKR